MIDGTIARKTGAASQFGASLDTAADFVFMAVCAIKILPLMQIPVWLWVWIITIALLKIVPGMLVLIRRKKWISIHSVFNKITGFALFLLPFVLPLVETAYCVGTVCVLATIAGIQEIYWIAKGKAV